MKDEIIEEIRKVRRQRSARFKHNIDAMFEDLRRSEEESKARGAKFVTPKRRQRSFRKSGISKARQP